MRDLLVVVHTESQHHVDRRVGGWYDSELSPTGRMQANTVAAEIRRRIPQGAPCSVHTSDLRRALQTADPIATTLGVEPTAMPGLREISYGDAEGRPQAWLDERFVPAPDHDRLDHGSGIDGAETKREFATRVYAAVDDILGEDLPYQVVVTGSPSRSS